MKRKGTETLRNSAVQLPHEVSIYPLLSVITITSVPRSRDCKNFKASVTIIVYHLSPLFCDLKNVNTSLRRREIPDMLSNEWVWID